MEKLKGYAVAIIYQKSDLKIVVSVLPIYNVHSEEEAIGFALKYIKDNKKDFFNFQAVTSEIANVPFNTM